MLGLLTLPAILKLLTFAPAVGYLGHAAYNLTVTKDLGAVGNDLGAAFAIIGIGGTVHSTHAAVK